MSRRLLVVTGASGRLGTYLRPALGELAGSARLVDVVAPPEPRAGESVEVLVGSVTDPGLMEAACEGADAIVHLGGYAEDAPWPELAAVNVGGTREVLEAACRHGVRRVVMASSNHAVGMRERGPHPLADDVAPFPDSLYGASKAAAEALCLFYSAKCALEVVCLRIGSCFDVPRDLRMLSTWLSPADWVRLVRASLEADVEGLRFVWGVSANTRRWWSTAGGDAIGFRPEDDAEAFAQLYTGEPPQPETVGGVRP